jgi:hypothetical protein
MDTKTCAVRAVLRDEDHHETVQQLTDHLGPDNLIAAQWPVGHPVDRDRER